MSNEETKELTPEELERTNGGLLPDREEMALITPGDPVQILPVDPDMVGEVPHGDPTPPVERPADR
jgi:hypothetical protein